MGRQQYVENGQVYKKENVNKTKFRLYPSKQRQLVISPDNFIVHNAIKTERIET